MQWLLTYLACLVTFLILDGLWLKLVAAKLYRSELDFIRQKPQLVTGILFYLLYSVGVTAFAVLPLSQHFDGVHASTDVLLRVFVWGAGLGVFAYSTFSLTNQAVIEGWKLKLSVLDLLWGGIVTGVISVVGFAIFRVLI